MLKEWINKLNKAVINEDTREKVLFRGIYLAFTVVSAVMTLVNIRTEFFALEGATAVFAMVCFVNFLLTFSNKRGIKVSSCLFAVEIIVLFTFFIINGSPEGFSAFWAPMLSACGALFFSFKGGIIVNLIMFSIIVFLCWVPYGRELVQFEYTESFFLRFPLLYSGYMLIGITLAFIIKNTQKALYTSSTHDALTGVYNRTGFLEMISSSLSDNNAHKTVGFMIIDIDLFKNVNDEYGHFFGDKVLRQTADIIGKYSNDSIVCRWGGEEFAVFIKDGTSVKSMAETIRSSYENNDYIEGDCSIHHTISIGAAEFSYKADLSANDMCKAADRLLYEVKANGRNGVSYRFIE